MDFMTVAEAAQKWGISPRSVRNYCAQGRVEGAFLTGKTWQIPVDAEKPRRAHVARKGNAPAQSALLTRLRQEKEVGAKGGIYHRLQVDLAYNSNHIEGSRLTLEQTRFIFETATIGIENAAVRVDDIIEAMNHFRAFDFVIENAAAPISPSLIKQLHCILKSATTDSARDWFAVGDYKRLPNEVAGRATTPPERVAADMEELLRRYKATGRSFEDIVEFHVGFERIHPFQDGNGRVGRLVMFKECLANGIVPFVIADDMKFFYYRGLAEWDDERGFLLETCRAAQDSFKALLDYFRIDYR